MQSPEPRLPAGEPWVGQERLQHLLGSVLSPQVKLPWILTALELWAVSHTPPSQQALPRGQCLAHHVAFRSSSFPAGVDVRVFPSRQRSSIR